MHFIRPYRYVVTCLILLAVALVHPLGWSSGLPSRDGLVLWLDAHDADSLSMAEDGAVRVWHDKSGQDNHAAQEDPARQPHRAPEGLLGRPAVRFDGGDYLNLGRGAELDFKPGDAFTIAVVSHVATQGKGTFLSKGGGAAGERAYQLYAAPGRRGAIVHGVMKEDPREGEPEAALAVCTGSRTSLYVNGALSLEFNGGAGVADVDVLVGARREKADNTGVFYLLEGDVAEILVYSRALDADERKALDEYLQHEHGLELAYTNADNVEKLAGLLAAPGGAGQLERVAQRLAKTDKPVAPALRALLAETPAATPLVAELLVCMARNNRLSPAMASLAGDFLGHGDPFVRGMAEWALAMKVGGENNGQEASWPCLDPPAWYCQWVDLSPTFRLEADWVRQAVSLGAHRDSSKLAASVDDMVARAQRMAADMASGGAAAERLSAVDGALSQLRHVQEAFHRAVAEGEEMPGLCERWMDARRHLRDMALANAAIGANGIVFVKQFAPHTVRNITRSYAWKHKPGGDICILEDVDGGGPAREVIQGRLGPGFVWGLDLWWNGDRAVFAYACQPNWPPSVNTADTATEGRNVFELRQQHEPLHLFEVRLDGSPPRQLTNDPYWSDFEPTYCANGDIVFASDRCGRSAECGNDTYDHTNPNLYLLPADGSGLRQWTDSKDIDRYPHSLDDGRIVYTHWEYQERHFMEVHALWTARPDGTMSDALYKHHMTAPCGLRDARSIPGTNRLVAIATGHHTFAYGPVVVVDPAKGMNNAAGLEIVTPGVKPQEGPMAGQPVADGGVKDGGGLYQTPWALSEKCFLVSYAYARPNCTAQAGADSNGFGIYLIDTYGNRELLHRDPLLSCTFPIPLRERPRPPVLPTMLAKADDAGKADQAEPSAAGYGEAGVQEEAACYVADVYQGLHGIERGTVRYLRISQHVGWPFDRVRGQMDYIPGNAGSRRVDFQSWSPVRVIGTVPVAADGSACFTVPADTALYFQALDENHMEIRRMRSMVSLKAGEWRGCTGCHESRSTAPAPKMAPLEALLRAPDRPAPPPWGSEKMVGYEWLVQPILDSHCVRCHGHDQPDGGLDLSATRTPRGLHQSFHTLFGLGPDGKKAGPVLVSCSDRFSNAAVSEPMQFGSHKSPFVRVLLDDKLHRDEVKLAPEEWLSLVTWVDANAPYHDAFINKRVPDSDKPKREVVPEFGPVVVLSKK